MTQKQNTTKRKSKNRYGFEKKTSATKLDRWISREVKKAAKSAGAATRKRKRKKNPAADLQWDADVLPFHAGISIWPDKRRVWNASAAEKRVRRWADAQDAPNALYQMAFLWHDSERPELFGSYKLPFCDVIHGKLYAIQRGLSAAKGRAGEVHGQDGRKLPRRELQQIYDTISLYQASAHRQAQAPRKQPPRYWRRRGNPELSGDQLELTVQGAIGRAHREALAGMKGRGAREQYYEEFEDQNAVLRARALAHYGDVDEVIAAAPAETPAMQKHVLEEATSLGERVTVEMSAPLLYFFQRKARELDEAGFKNPMIKVFVEEEEVDPTGTETFQVQTYVVGWELLADGVKTEWEDKDLPREIRDTLTREINAIRKQYSVDEGEKGEAEGLQTLDDYELSGEESYLYSDEPSKAELDAIDEEDEEDEEDDEEWESIPDSPAVVEVKEADQDIEEEGLDDGLPPVPPEDTLGGVAPPNAVKVIGMMANIIEDSTHGHSDQVWQVTDPDFVESWDEKGELVIHREFLGASEEEWVVTLLCLNIAAPNWVAAAQEVGELSLGPVYAVFLDAWDPLSEEFYGHSDILTKDAKKIKNPEKPDCSFPVYLNLDSLLSLTLRDYLSSQTGLTYKRFLKQIPLDECAPQRFSRERASNPSVGVLLPMAYALTSCGRVRRKPL